MSDILRQQDEMLDNLSGMSAELIRATRDAKKLRGQLLGISKVVENKNYEILSRFLSGTGAWRVLNKFKATTQTLSQLLSVSERSIYKEAETLQGLAKLEEKRAKFSELSRIAAKAEGGDRKAIVKMMEQIPEVKGLAAVIGEKSAIIRYGKFIKKANTEVRDTMKSLGGKAPANIFQKVASSIGGFKKSILRETSKLDPNYKKFQSGSKREGAIMEGGRFVKNRGTPMQILKELRKQSKVGLVKFVSKITDKVSFVFSPSRYKERQKKFAGVADKVKNILTLFSKFFIGFSIFVIAFFLLYRILKNGEFVQSIIGTIMVFGQMLFASLSLVWEGISSIVEGFRSGDFYKVIGGLVQVAFGLVGIAVTVASTLIIGAVLLVYSVIKGTVVALLSRMTSSVSKFVSTLLYIGAGIAFLVAFFGGGWIPVLVGAVLTGVGMLIEKIVPFANGGTVSNRGMQLVGEKGPELVKLPVGSRVFSNSDSKKMVSGGGTTNNITVQVSGRVGASDQEIKDIARKVSREIGLQMNRTGSTAVRF